MRDSSPALAWEPLPATKQDTNWQTWQRYVNERIATIYAVSPDMLGVETMNSAEEADGTPTLYPNCRCDLSPTQETQESTQETQESSQEDTPPTPRMRWDCHWNHDTGKVEWQRIEEPIEVKPKPLATEKPKYNHASRRQLRQALWRIVYKAQRRKARRQPQVCPQCMAPMLGIHLTRYGTTPEGEPSSTVIGHDFWQCQCKLACKPRSSESVEEEE